MHGTTIGVLAIAVLFGIMCLGTCVNINDVFRVATESLGPEVYRIASFDSIFLNLIDRGMFPKGVGLTRSVFKVGNTLPTDDEPTWNAITLATGSNAGACAEDRTAISVGFDELTYSPVSRQIMGPVFCKDDMYFDHNVDEFLAAYVDEMGKYAGMEFGNRLYVDYVKMIPKMVATAANPITVQTTLVLPVATSQLTQQMLEHAAAYLTVNRANNPDGQGFTSYGPNGPLYSILIGVQASMDIKRNNPELRYDLRFADEGMGDGARLLYRLGATQAVGNFRHVPNVTPPRYSHNGTTFTRVPTFAVRASTKGVVIDVNPNWEDPATAPYEAAIVLSKYVMRADIVEPASSHPGGVVFNPGNYMGEWVWVTGSDAVGVTADGKSCDPLHKQGRHFAEWKYAPKPLSTPKSGMIILFKRCPVSAYDQVTCS